MRAIAVGSITSDLRIDVRPALLSTLEGLESEDAIEITRGLAPGDTVLVDGHLTLAHGAPVRVNLVGE